MSAPSEVQKDVVVSFHYTLKDGEGETLDSSDGGDAMSYLHGADNIVPGLENELTGKVVGDNSTLLSSRRTATASAKGLRLKRSRSPRSLSRLLQDRARPIVGSVSVAREPSARTLIPLASTSRPLRDREREIGMKLFRGRSRAREPAESLLSDRGAGLRAWLVGSTGAWSLPASRARSTTASISALPIPTPRCGRRNGEQVHLCPHRRCQAALRFGRR